MERLRRDLHEGAAAARRIQVRLERRRMRQHLADRRKRPRAGAQEHGGRGRDRHAEGGSRAAALHEGPGSSVLDGSRRSPAQGRARAATDPAPRHRASRRKDRARILPGSGAGDRLQPSVAGAPFCRRRMACRALDPNPEFSTSGYLALHAGVREAGVNPYLHFLSRGAIEGRAFERSKIVVQSDAAATVVEREKDDLEEPAFETALKGPPPASEAKALMEDAIQRRQILPRDIKILEARIDKSYYAAQAPTVDFTEISPDRDRPASRRPQNAPPAGGPVSIRRPTSRRAPIWRSTRMFGMRRSTRTCIILRGAPSKGVSSSVRRSVRHRAPAGFTRRIATTSSIASRTISKSLIPKHRPSPSPWRVPISAPPWLR